MNGRDRQAALLALVKGRQAKVAGDAWLERVAGSRELGMIREIALWWRRFQIEAQCRFTSRMLKRLGRYDAIVAAYFDTNRTSPFIEELGADFLAYVAESGEADCARQVARFERALLRVREAPDEITEICWDRHPVGIIESLERHDPLPPPETARYRMLVGGPIDGLIECSRA
jgi:hypothetical protein